MMHVTRSRSTLTCECRLPNSVVARKEATEDVGGAGWINDLLRNEGERMDQLLEGVKWVQGGYVQTHFQGSYDAFTRSTEFGYFRSITCGASMEEAVHVGAGAKELHAGPHLDTPGNARQPWYPFFVPLNPPKSKYRRDGCVRTGVAVNHDREYATALEKASRRLEPSLSCD